MRKACGINNIKNKHKVHSTKLGKKRENIEKRGKKMFKRHTHSLKHRNNAVAVKKENICYVFKAVGEATAARGRGLRQF